VLGGQAVELERVADAHGVLGWQRTLSSAGLLQRLYIVLP
jgi:hypothetical protein